MVGPASRQSSELYRFDIKVLEPGLDGAEVQHRIDEATRDALAGLDLQADAAEVQLEGGFAGIGELSVSLLVTTLVLAALSGAGKAAGEYFVKELLIPRLRKVNLLATRVRRGPDPPADEEKKPDAATEEQKP